MVHAVQSEKKVSMKIASKLVWLIIAAPAVYLAIIWKELPATIAIHFDLYGNPDRYGSKKELILLVAIIVGVNMLVYLLLTNIHRFDPKKSAVENKGRLSRIAFATALFMSALLVLIIYSTKKGGFDDISIGLIFSGVGLLFAVIGNYMPNMKPNYFAGMRLPWTLENPENWRKTHALAGRLWFGGGLLIAVVCLFTPPLMSIIFFFVVMLMITIIPGVYSYRLHKKNKNANQ
jgi:uncharacterized membrane protein